MSIWWIIVLSVAGVLLIVFFNGRNAVWGAMTWGALAGLVLSLILWAVLGTFSWWYIAKVGAIGTIIGSVTEIDYIIKKRRNTNK